jgi:hypothetical protein
MPNQGFDYDAFRDLLEGANVIGKLAADEQAFRAAYEAFRAADAKTYQEVLNRLGLLSRCERICEWLRLKECVFLCIELCGIPKPIDKTPDPRLLAEVIVKLTSDEKLVQQLVEMLDTRNKDLFQRLVKEFNLGPICHLFCHWLCVVRYRLICRWVCNPVLTEKPNLAQELQSAGQALRLLLEHGDAFSQAVAASNAGDAAKLGSVIGGIDQLVPLCYFICEWFCSWRCTLVCLTLCHAFPVEPIRDEIGEALAFAKSIHKLTQNPLMLERLVSAVTAGDAKGYSAVIKELALQRYCIQVCHWVCGLLCRRFCTLVCPPIYLHPWFTHVGDFSITADIDGGTGLTNKSEAGHGGPNFGFFGKLSLRGFCPKIDPAHAGAAMAYRFLYQPAGAPKPTPITGGPGGGLVGEVLVGSRYTLWHGNPFTLQSVRIRGTGTTSPTPPPFTPDPAPPDHYIVPDPQGWVPVDQNALDDGFDGWLMGFASWVAFPGGDPAPGVSAGTAVPGPNQKNGTDSAIIFQATRVSTIAAVNGGAAPDYTNQLAKIHINNWNEVSLIDLQEFAGGLKCNPVTNDLHILYTTDHELMAAWSIDMVTAATVTPAPTFPSGTGPRGGAGTDFHDTSKWPSCSYLLRLHTVRSLTDGLLDDTDKWESSFLTFCVEH